jgi:hypothetical protein
MKLEIRESNRTNAILVQTNFWQKINGPETFGCARCVRLAAIEVEQTPGDKEHQRRGATLSPGLLLLILVADEKHSRLLDSGVGTLLVKLGQKIVLLELLAAAQQG